MNRSPRTRRDFLRLLGGGAAVLAAGAGCASGPDTAKPKATSATTAPSAGGKRTLRIAQWNNYVAGYDEWWDEEYTRRWGERNGIAVTVDHFDINQAAAHAEAEAASQRGHDIVHLNLASAAPFEDDVIDHREIVEEVERRVGKMHPFIDRAIRNPKTNKYFAFSDYWSPNPVHYRTDLWGPTGLRPDTWEDVRVAGTRLKAAGHPVGIGMGLDPESNVTLLGLLHGFGSSVQDEEGNVVVNSRATVEAVKLGAAVFRSAMTDDVLNWDITSNNRYLISGRGSFIVNAIAAIRALEIQDPALAAKVQLAPMPAGPAGTASPYAISVFVIWKFSESQDAAKQFLIDLASAYREPFLQSQFLQMPAFPGALPDLADVVAADPRAQPPDKYRFLTDAAAWSTNAGHPGHTNAAIDEVVKVSIISQMFAAAARGDTTPEDAVKDADARIRAIYEKWRERGKI